MKKFLNILISFFFSLFNEKLNINYQKKKDFIKKKNFTKLKNFKIFIIKNGKIFTNSNEDAAYLKKNSVISDASYQYRNSKNTNIKKNFIFKNGINRFKKQYKGKVVSIISGGAAKIIMVIGYLTQFLD